MLHFSCRVYDYSFYFGVIIPFGLVYIFNWVIFILIMVSLSSRPNLKKEGSKKANYRKLKENLWVAMGLSVLFGLGWGIGLLATTGLPSFIHIIFEWAFTIMTAFQGLIIFILYCLRAAEVRKVWKRILCCESKRPKHSLEPSSSGWTGTLATKITTLGRRTSQSLAKRFTIKQRTTTTKLSSTHVNEFELSTLQSGQMSKTDPSHYESEYTSQCNESKANIYEPNIYLQPKEDDSSNSQDSFTDGLVTLSCKDQQVEVQIEQTSNLDIEQDVIKNPYCQ